jgi:hypothetical protein
LTGTAPPTVEAYKRYTTVRVEVLKHAIRGPPAVRHGHEWRVWQDVTLADGKL